jgi:NADH-quinone oxidoreductase subunit A
VPQETLHQDFLTILVFLVFGGLFVIANMVLVGRLIRSKTDYTEGKSAVYECGEPTFGSAFVRFDIRFYVLALVFAIFDVEVVFLFPWAVVMKSMGPLAWLEAAAFVAVLGVGLAYIWRKGDIDWIPLHGHKRQASRILEGEVTRVPTTELPPGTPVGPGASAPAVPAAPAVTR